MPTIQLYANLRQLGGAKEVSITGATLGHVLTELVKQNPLFGEVLFDDEEIHPNVVITKNGHHIIDLEESLTEEDIVAIFPPIAGG